VQTCKWKGDLFQLNIWVDFFLATKRRGKFLILKNQSESERYYLNKFLVCFFDSFDRQIKTKNK
jgi:hypothetical protein